MKTSNAILSGFLVLLFIVPFLIASILKSKVDKKQYTIVRHDKRNFVKRVSQALGAVKVLYVAASDPGLLHCRMRATDSSKYVYRQYNSTDSLTVYERGDTLFILHPSAILHTPQSRLSYLEIDVYLPRFDNLIVDGASVFLDSMPNPAGNVSVILRNGGRVSNE